MQEPHMEFERKDALNPVLVSIKALVVALHIVTVYITSYRMQGTNEFGNVLVAD